MSNSSTRLFLVQPLDAEPLQVPENAHVVRADSLETLLEAQSVKETVLEFISGNLSFRKVKQLLRPK